MDNILNFHIENKYCVQVNKVNHGCSVSFPPNYILEPPIVAKNLTYKVCPEGFRINEEDKYKICEIDNYAVRFAILTDILMKSKSRQIPNKLIIIKNGDKIVSSLISILPAPNSEDMIQRERLLTQVYADIVIGLFDLASANKLGIGEGFKKLSDLIESGGL